MMGMWSGICCCGFALLVARLTDMFRGHIKFTIISLLVVGCAHWCWLLAIVAGWAPFSTSEYRLLLMLLLLLFCLILLTNLPVLFCPPVDLFCSVRQFTCSALSASSPVLFCPPVDLFCSVHQLTCSVLFCPPVHLFCSVRQLTCSVLSAS